MSGVDLDELQDFVVDALNGHYPEAFSEEFKLLKEDYGTISFYRDVSITDYCDWMCKPNSKSTIIHSNLESMSYVEQEILRAHVFYSFRMKEAIRIKGTNKYVVIKSDELSPLDVGINY